MEWLFIIILLIAIFLFVKVTNIGQNLWSYAIVILIIFLLVTIAYVSTFSNVKIKSFDGLVDFGRIYVAWINNFFKNIGQITGNAINLDWSLNSTKE